VGKTFSLLFGYGWKEVPERVAGGEKEVLEGKFKSHPS